MKMSRCELAKSLFTLREDPLTFDKHLYMVDVINDSHPKLLLKCSRQVGKSTILSLRQGTNVAATNSGVKGFQQIYVTPSHLQTRTYVIEKLRPLFYESPRFATIFTDKNTMNNIDTQTFRNGAKIFLRAANYNADRVRGIPADELDLDEIQDMLVSNIPVMSSCLDMSPLGYQVMCGTPLTEENPIEEFWQLSTQTEWMVPCPHHTPRLWNIPSVENIGKTGFICKKCGNLLDTDQGKWVDLYPDAFIKGYHISQLIVKLKQTPARWHNDIVFKMETWPEEKFYNETLGVSMGQAGRPFSIPVLQAACSPSLKCKLWDSSKFYDAPPTRKVEWYAGVDWGEGREEAVYEGAKKKYASFTHLVIGAYDSNGIFFPAYWHKFRGKEEIKPDYVVKWIIDKCKEWGVIKIAVDWGFGWGVNERIMKGLGYTNVMQCYHSSALKELYQWDSEAVRYTLNRTAMITNIIADIQNKKIGFPEWKHFEPYARDFLAVYSEYNHNTNRLQYAHSIQEPDDGMHTLLYARFAADWKKR